MGKEMYMKRNKTKTPRCGVSRRDFLLGSATAGAMALLSACSDQDESQQGSTADEAAPDASAEAAAAAMVGEPWVSSNLLGNLSTDYEPGPEEDFYVHVDREWLLNAGLEEGELQNVPMITGAQHVAQDRCAELLLEGGSDESDIRSVQNYFALMLDWQGRDAAGIAGLEEVLARIDAVSSIDDLSALFQDADASYPLGLLEIQVSPDVLDGSKYAVYADMSPYTTFDDSAEYANPTNTGKITLQMEHDIFTFVAGKTLIAERAEEIFEASQAYQAEMAAHYPTAADVAKPGTRQAMAQNRMTKAELVERFGAFPTEGVLEARGYADVDEFITMTPEGDAYVASCYDEEHLEGIKALLMTSLIKDTKYYLTTEIYNTVMQTSADSQGIAYLTDDLHQHRLALQMVYNSLPSPVSKLYVSRYANDEMRTEIRSLCEDLVAVYKEMVAHEDWLSEQTRAYAIEKLDAMGIMSLYPDKWEDYSALDIKSAAEGETLWSAYLATKEFEESRMRSQVGQEVDKELLPNCIDANCQYEPSKNRMQILAGFLSDATYASDMSQEEKMGRLGAVIGHEISHGFDTTGMLYDKDGATNNWWTDDDLAAYQERAQKISAWYDEHYKPLGEVIEGFGTRVLGETIADAGGLTAMLTLARSIDGFDYDAFFRANADMWRRLDNDYAFQYMLQTDVHPMQMTRVNLNLAQCDEFQQTYGVKEGDKMYFAPEDRVILW